MCEGGQARLHQAGGGIRGRGDNTHQDAKRKNSVLLTGKADGQASEGHLEFVRPLTGSVEGPVTTAGKLCPQLVPSHSRPQGPAQELGFNAGLQLGRIILVEAASIPSGLNRVIHPSTEHLLCASQ